MKKKPGVILSTAFVLPKSQTFSQYIQYMDREEAVRNQYFNTYNAFSPNNQKEAYHSLTGKEHEPFGNYNDYVSNPEKTSALFTRLYDETPTEILQQLKNYFDQSQQAGSPLWQHVFSFQNDWLIEQGILSAETKEVDRHRLIEATRVAMKTLEEKEGLQGEWTGAIHYNTDNIHIHVGYTEIESTRKLATFFSGDKKDIGRLERKGKLLVKSLRATKGKFVNELLALTDFLTHTTEEFRLLVSDTKKNQELFLEGHYRDLLQKLYQVLPANQSRWKYGYAKNNDFKTEIDAIIDFYLRTEGKEQFLSIKHQIKKLSAIYEEAYGNPRNLPTYEDNKLYGKNGLYHTLGNVILQFILAQEQALKQNSIKKLSSNQKQALEIENQVVSYDFANTSDEESLRHLVSQEPVFEEQFKAERADQLPSTFSEDEPSQHAKKNLQMQQALNKIIENFAENKETYQKNQALVLLKEEDTQLKEKRRAVVGKVVETGGFQTKYLGRASFVDELESTAGKLAKDGKEKNKLHNLENFSVKNQLAILTQCPHATLVFGPNQWLLQKRELIVGAVGIQVMVPDKTTYGRLMFKEITVYDISETRALDSGANTVFLKERHIQGSKKRPGQKSNSVMDEFLEDTRRLRKMLKKSTQDYLNEGIFKKLTYEKDRGI
ncbi:MobP2 family relaxase [Enterococcus casseliflavus]|uniref:MobP2 family relaxase n=1 Tax=Enterococcus casseliflavus TaxID=37734 RepID=UPI0034D2D1BA